LLASLREANEGLEQTLARRTKALQAENAERRRAEKELLHTLDDVRQTHAELQRTQAMTPGGTLTARTFASTKGGGDSDAPAGVIVEVDDTGRGILPENADKVFEPFFTTKPPGQGTGLGLAIVRRIMEIHGGSVRLSNRNEGGARATLQFNTEPRDQQ